MFPPFSEKLGVNEHSEFRGHVIFVLIIFKLAYLLFNQNFEGAQVIELFNIDVLRGFLSRLVTTHDHI